MSTISRNTQQSITYVRNYRSENKCRIIAFIIHNNPDARAVVIFEIVVRRASKAFPRLSFSLYKSDHITFRKKLNKPLFLLFSVFFSPHRHLTKIKKRTRVTTLVRSTRLLISSLLPRKREVAICSYARRLLKANNHPARETG